MCLYCRLIFLWHVCVLLRKKISKEAVPQGKTKQDLLLLIRSVSILSSHYRSSSYAFCIYTLYRFSIVKWKWFWLWLLLLFFGIYGKCFTVRRQMDWFVLFLSFICTARFIYWLEEQNPISEKNANKIYDQFTTFFTHIRFLMCVHTCMFVYHAYKNMV